MNTRDFEITMSGDVISRKNDSCWYNHWTDQIIIPGEVNEKYSVCRLFVETRKNAYKRILQYAGILADEGKSKNTVNSFMLHAIQAIQLDEPR